MDAATPRKPYPSDRTDGQWEVLAIHLPAAKPGGRPRSVDLREVVNAILYQNRSGCQWDMLPNDLPARSTVYEYFAAWRDNGTWERVMDALREVCRECHAPEKDATPSAGSVDSQTVKTAGAGGPVGYDGGKKTKGRKRTIAVDTLGLMLAVAVTGANVDDAKAAEPVRSRLTAERFPRLQVLWADSKYHNHALNGWRAERPELGWRLEVVSRPPGVEGVRGDPEAVGRGADVRVARAGAAAEQGLRAANRFERVHDPRPRHPDDVMPTIPQTGCHVQIY